MPCRSPHRSHPATLPHNSVLPPGTHILWPSLPFALPTFLLILPLLFASPENGHVIAACTHSCSQPHHTGEKKKKPAGRSKCHILREWHPKTPVDLPSVGQRPTFSGIVTIHIFRDEKNNTKWMNSIHFMWKPQNVQQHHKAAYRRDQQAKQTHHLTGYDLFFSRCLA